MTNIRRYFEVGQYCFMTHVTYNRVPLLIEHFDLLAETYDSIVCPSQISLLAYVVLPEHLHALIRLEDADISQIVKRFKLKFSGLYRSKLGLQRGRVWQYRFWDHIIRDEDDLRRHLDYIHFNPVKHGLASDPFDYEYSSARDFLQRGMYEEGWGRRDASVIRGEFGE
ncbi:MAG: transposase [bacterium]